MLKTVLDLGTLNQSLMVHCFLELEHKHNYDYYYYYHYYYYISLMTFFPGQPE